jgi:hypothetical protein
MRGNTMKTKTAVNRSGAKVQTRVNVDSQVYTVGLTVIGVSACAIGLWAVASLIGGMAASGGPVALVADWFKAVFGM